MKSIIKKETKQQEAQSSKLPKLPKKAMIIVAVVVGVFVLGASVLMIQRQNDSETESKTPAATYTTPA